MAQRRYTKAEQATAVGIAIAESQTVAAEKLGIPLTTINQWYHRPDFAGMRTTAREEVAESMWTGVQIGVTAMVKALQDDKVSLRDKTDATSMLAEKYLLLTGQATSRHETITEGWDDQEKGALREAIRGHLDKREVGV